MYTVSWAEKKAKAKLGNSRGYTLPKHFWHLRMDGKKNSFPFWGFGLLAGAKCWFQAGIAVLLGYNLIVIFAHEAYYFAVAGLNAVGEGEQSTETQELSMTSIT